MISLNEWTREGAKFAFPNTPDGNNWYTVGFFPKNDYSVDVGDYLALEFELAEPAEKAGQIRVNIGYIDSGEINYENIVHTEYVGAVEAGDRTVTAYLEEFDYLSSRRNVLKFVRYVEFDREVKDPRFIKSKGIYAYSDVYSKPAAHNETASYTIRLENETDKPKAYSISLKKDGWEVCDVSFSERFGEIEPYGRKDIVMSVKMSDRIPGGGFEKQTVNIVTGGAGGQTLEFMTVSELEHPYIIHNKKGWREVREKMDKYEWAKKAYDKLYSQAADWEIPATAEEDDSIAATMNAHKAYMSAIIWTLGGEERFLKNSAAFLKHCAFWYPQKLRACDQELVHEGEFFKSIAVVYDLTYDTDEYSDQDRADIEKMFRIFIGRIDWELETGGYSNWSLAEIAGALQCSECLQDRALIERFAFGKGGITDHISKCVLDDGWWYECSIGYNLMSAALLTQLAHCLLPWGIDLTGYKVPANYSRDVQSTASHKDGLVSSVYGPSKKNYRNIEMLWDSLVALADYRSVVPGVNDSTEMRLTGNSERGDDARYDIAYAVYKKPEYAEIVRRGGEENRDLIYGVGELPDVSTDISEKSYYFDNAGVAILRSRKEGVNPDKQIQASLKYGSHGGAHGHYDRTSLMSISRYGRSFYNPENIWYSYHTFLYKFMVQTGITHNMTLTDLKMQDPQEGERLMFYSGETFQACAVNNKAKWSYPPYGGWRVGVAETFEERCWKEGRYVPIPPEDERPEYTKRSGFTEPIDQTRVLVVADDFVVVFDSVAGEEEHDYDCVYHFCGFREMDGAKHKGHTEQLTTNPLSSGQFVTDCDWYDCEGDVKLGFEMEFDESTRKHGWLVPFRTSCNEPGTLKMNVFYPDLKDKGSELILGSDPQYFEVQHKLYYEITDGEKALKAGQFGAWILGRDDIVLDITGADKLVLKTKYEKPELDLFGVANPLKSIFWGDPYIVTKSGERKYLCDMDVEIDELYESEKNKDYYGGGVKIAGREFKHAIGAEPTEENTFGSITVDLSGMEAESFVASIGSDYPLGGEEYKRYMVSQRKRGKSARFATVIEPHEDEPLVARVSAEDENTLVVEMRDGTQRIVRVSGLDAPHDEKISVRVESVANGEIIGAEESE